MKKFNEIVFKEMERQGITKNHLCQKAKLSTSNITRFARGFGISTVSLEKILDLLFPGWEGKF